MSIKKIKVKKNKPSVISEEAMKVIKSLGAIGGSTRAKNLSGEELSKIGKLGAKARWAKK